MFSTGIGLYYADTVGYDQVKGQAVITPVPRADSHPPRRGSNARSGLLTSEP
jgi:hypothetical protein